MRAGQARFDHHTDDRSRISIQRDAAVSREQIIIDLSDTYECRLKRMLSIVSAGRYLSQLGPLEDWFE